MKGKRSPILVMLILLSLSVWSARAEPPVTLSTDQIAQEDATLGADEIKQEDGSGIRGSRPPSPEPARTLEQELQEDHEAAHQRDAGAHEHGADTHQHDSGAHEHGADTHQHESGTGEHVTGAEEMGSHSRMHEMGRMERGTEGNHGGRMHGGH
jgi:hypothetical protein